jgi:Tol biopolymer transport system component
MNGDGTNVVPIIDAPSFQFGPSWSPDGTQIALVRQVPGIVMGFQFDIFVVNTDGTGEVNITSSDFDELHPAWAPDGTKVAFSGVRFEEWTDPSTGEPGTAAPWEIVTVNPDGSGEQIVSAGDPGTPRAQALEQDWRPAWAPDSSALVFSSQGVDPCCTTSRTLIAGRIVGPRRARCRGLVSPVRRRTGAGRRFGGNPLSPSGSS